MSFYMSDKVAKEYLIKKVEKYDNKERLTKKGSECSAVISIVLIPLINPTIAGFTLVGLSAATATILGIASEKYKNKEEYYKNLFETYNKKEKQKIR